MKIWLVDAFTDTPFKGNPAGVLLIKDFPKDEECQKIAAEINLPITVFMIPLAPNHYHIRWFSPTVEMELCGHGTLAAAHILFQEGYDPGEEINFDSLSGPLSVRGEESGIILNFPLYKVEGLPFSIQTLKDLLDLKSVTHACVSHDAVLAELSNEDELRTLTLDPKKVMKLDQNGVILTAQGKPPYDFVSRVFGPRKGINEDPVTGSAHCLLADYWQKKMIKDEFLAYQASPRGGEIGIKVVGDRVYLKGQALTIMEGTWKA